MKKTNVFLIILSFLSLTSCKNDKESTTEDKSLNSTSSKIGSSIGENPTRDVYWGDQHLHTAWSADAGAAGTRVGPEEALRFARGEEIDSNTGKKAKLNRPLDWLAITDHSDGAGVINAVIEGDPLVMKDPIVAQYHDDMEAGGEKAAAVMMDLINRQATGTLPPVFTDPDFLKTIWERNIDIVEKYNEPGTFTAFISYEWSSNYGGGITCIAM